MMMSLVMKTMILIRVVWIGGAVGWPLRIVCRRSIMVGAGKDTHLGNIKIRKSACWVGAEILSTNQRLQKCERFLPCIEKLSQRSVTPVFHQLRLMDCFEIWGKPVKLFSITSQNSDTTSVLSLSFGNCFKVLH